MKNAVKSILDTLGENDFVNIVEVRRMLSQISAFLGGKLSCIRDCAASKGERETKFFLKRGWGKEEGVI